ANSEESASAAEELSSQAEEMRSLVARFKLSNASNSYSSPRAAQSANYQLPAQPKKQPEKVLVGAGAGRKNGKNGSHPIDPRKAIPFDDDQTLQEF
ncbi:MAG: hypothetical protein ABFD64_12615, partial [Armatimonadota bacterium]